MSYFKPLRRKLGIATLMVACVFTTGWVRSRFLDDSIQLTTKAFPLITFSSRLSILDTSWFDDKLKFKFHNRWKTTPIKYFKRDPKSNRMIWWDTRTIETAGTVLHTGTSFSAHYGVIVFPLTVLSAWLLLSKPNAPKSIDSHFPTPR